MAISFVAIATARNDAGATLTINVPAGTADGDLMIACLYTSGAAVFLAEAGWVDYGVVPAISAANKFTSLMHRFASGEPASYTFDVPAAVGAKDGYICTYRGITTYSVDIKFAEFAGGPPPKPNNIAAQVNPVGAVDLLLHRPIFGLTQFGTLVTHTVDAALNRRGDVPVIGSTGVAFERLTATDEIYNGVADYPARTLTIDNTGHNGNMWSLNILMRPLLAQVVGSAPGFGFGANEPFGP